MAKKYYAVRVGVTPGVYETWEECEHMVQGFPGAKYKSFKTYTEALAFVNGQTETTGEQMSFAANEKKQQTKNAHIGDQVDVPYDEEWEQDDYAFVDGSFNAVTKVYGYGGFLVNKGARFELQGSGDDEELATMRNVAGEIMGCMAAVKKALEFGMEKLTIFYDYAGIEQWATGSWKRNKQGTIAYYEYMQQAQKKIKLEFVKVKGHSGIWGNEEADRLAKESVGLL